MSRFWISCRLPFGLSAKRGTIASLAHRPMLLRPYLIALTFPLVERKRPAGVRCLVAITIGRLSQQGWTFADVNLGASEELQVGNSLRRSATSKIVQHKGHGA